jgi:hypothetical protein
LGAPKLTYFFLTNLITKPIILTILIPFGQHFGFREKPYDHR